MKNVEVGGNNETENASRSGYAASGYYEILGRPLSPAVEQDLSSSHRPTTRSMSQAVKKEKAEERDTVVVEE
jgi:hypothetical protein